MGKRNNIAPDLEPLSIELDAIQPDPENARKRTDANNAAIRASFDTFGQQRPLLVFRFRKNDRPTVISGNGGWAAAKSLGWTKVAVSRFMGTATQARAYAIADNRSGELSEWDAAVLGVQVEILRASQEVNDLLDALDLDGLLPESGDEEAAEDVMPDQPEPIAKLGDRWRLGTHRLACGDNRDPKAVAFMLEGGAPACIFTDPPYGVSYQSSSGKHEAIANDELTGDSLVRFLQDSLGPLANACRPTAAWYVWHSGSTRDEFSFALKAIGLMEISTIIWAKPSAVLGYADYQFAHEACYYMARAGERPDFYGDRKQTTVWRFASRAADGTRAVVIRPGVLVSDGHGATIYVTLERPKKKTRAVRLEAGGKAVLTPDSDTTTLWEVGREANPGHPTQKPVELVVRALHNSTVAGDIVADPFSGSGSTLLGCERTGRIFVGAELSPAYVDLSIARWEKATRE